MTIVMCMILYNPQLAMVFAITWPPLFKDTLRWLGVTNLDLVQV